MSQRGDDRTVYQKTQKHFKLHEQSPPNWRDTTTKVMHKSGSPSSPSTCRPICSIPILYRLFSQLFFKRLQPTLDANQFADQAGNSDGETLSGTSHCGSQPLTSKKTFDTVKQSSAWKTLREQGTEEPYIQLLTKLYGQQRASVHTDVKSKHVHRAGNQAGRPTQHALVQVAPTIHLQSTYRKVEQW